MRYYALLMLGSLLLLQACKSDDGEVAPTLPVMDIADAGSVEGNAGVKAYDFEVKLTGEYTDPVTIDYETIDATAFAGQDYEKATGSLTFTSPETTKTITINVIGDEAKEGNEKFKVALINPQNVTLGNATAEGRITNEDGSIPYTADGYTTPTSYEDWNLTWADEFDIDGAPNPANWTHEIGNGSGGWGNNEDQYYTDNSTNSRVTNGNLIIEAKKETTNGFAYTSARMITKGKQEFRFGRVDIRAKLPKGQGLWPALWMLGADIDSEGWPACGEIDIMELVGHEPRKTHGTCHVGIDPSQHYYTGGSFSINEDFDERFHVFSIVWEPNVIWFYVDDYLYYEYTINNTNGQPYPFNDKFFFIFNVAVGGNWPGAPDNTTVFPQQMIVDYVRVFQKK